MVYGQLQYYHDELATWEEVVESRKRELREQLRHISVLLDFPVVSLPVSRSGNAFVDRLIVLEQQFDYLRNLLRHQLQRIERVIPMTEGPDATMVQMQKTLRTKLRVCETTFIKTKFDCSVLISGFFEAGVVHSQL